MTVHSPRLLSGWGFLTGPLQGIAKAFYGLSASMYSRVYATWFTSSVNRFLFFVACTPLLGLVVLFGIRVTDPVRCGACGRGACLWVGCLRYAVPDFAWV